MSCDGCRYCSGVDYLSEDSEDDYFLRTPREMNDPVPPGPVEADTVRSLAPSGISLDGISLNEFDSDNSEIFF